MPGLAPGHSSRLDEGPPTGGPSLVTSATRHFAPRRPMNLEKVIFGFFIILACTLNFGFFIGDLERPELHHPMELFAAVVVNLIATVLKFSDRTQLGTTHLATSLVASLQLLAASLVWVWR